MDFEFIEFIKKICSNSNWLIIFLFCVIFVISFGPIIFCILKLLGLLYHIILFNFHLLFCKNKKKNNSENDLNKVSINNNIPTNNNDLSLIELKMLEFNYKEDKKKQLYEQDLFRLEINQKINQNKIENKIDLIKYKNYLEKQKFEQKIIYLEEEIKRIKNRDKCQENNNNFSDANNKDKKEIDFDYIDEFIKKQIPESLKQIFEKISDFENVQLFMLNKFMDNNKNNHNNNSYYDSSKNILYINEKDLIFIKTLLIDKTKENRRLN